MSDIKAYLQRAQQRVNHALSENFKQLGTHAPQLLEAMHYSLFAAGKRVRPTLVFASAEAVAGAESLPLVDASACALECIHTYSLIHDDLPAMDDDDLRRGLPTCHIAYDEATAILAGDALQSWAFQLLAETPGPAEQRIQLVAELSKAAGAEGMVAGQTIDLSSVAKTLSRHELEAMHRLKTGALISASVTMGALAAGEQDSQKLSALARYASAIGLSFQVQDDILDVTGDTQTLGKQSGADAHLSKPTYVSLLGLDNAQALAKQLHEDAIDALHGFGPSAEPLRQLSSYIVERES
ncbi:polyprenyl synthetase family protein [Aurantivibrio plasticivorans]